MAMSDDDPADAETSTRDTAPLGAPRPTIDHGSFQPGTVLSQRYRIASLLGRGGMGEVYRTDDLRLGQPVALKFIRAPLANDPGRLARLHEEVRIARQVSHPNVCRVYDIGECNGRLFLSMEYVDGEDLAASLRRIGRLPEDRAIEIARQLCAALAAAHERGVVHRDLKPANIMLDGSGRVRVMDFGIATVGGDDPSRAGTPAYMSPEQLEGQPATPRSDIYALGLVLYELFTGRSAVTDGPLPELARRHTSGDITPPSEHVRSMHPSVERAIMRCLNRQPERRPVSALAVSALLPGVDLYGTALFAGETPSPEMVAAAGDLDTVISARAAALLVAGLLSLGTLAGWMYDRSTVAGQAAMRKPAPVLAEYARQVHRLAGTWRPASAGPIAADAQYEATGFAYDVDALRWYDAHGGPAERWSAIAGSRLPVVRFWYRASDSRIDPANPNGPPTPTDPPASHPGDAIVELDAEARLLRFAQTPPATNPAGDAMIAPPDWAAFFRAAGLDMRAFSIDPSGHTPPSFADTVVSWRGRSPLRPGDALRVDAASLHSRPVSFVVTAPWTGWRAPSSTAANVAAIVSAAISVVLVVTAVWLALTNVRTSRADRDGAYRVAVVAFTLQVVRWLLEPAHSSEPGTEALRIYMGLAFGLLFAAVVGGAYLGLEPFVRRYWPRALVGWTRLLTGRVRDPVVGRDLLVGTAIGFISPVIASSYQLVPSALGGSVPAGWLPLLTPATGLASVLPLTAFNVNWSLVNGLFGMFILAAIRRAVGSLWVAAALSVLVFALLGDPATTIDFGRPRLLALLCLQTVPMVIVLLRFGLLAGVACALSGNLMGNAIFTLDPSRAYFAGSLVEAAAIVGVGLVGWRFARGGSV
jgi:predicted Ser/Thr protein kinase